MFLPLSTFSVSTDKTFFETLKNMAENIKIKSPNQKLSGSHLLPNIPQAILRVRTEVEKSPFQ